MATRMQQRRGTAAQWTAADPVLGAGEIGWETDTNKFKIGDGVNNWGDLNYFLDAVALGGSIDDYIPLTQKGAANGVATLNSSAKIPSSQLDIDELSQDAVNTALTAGTGITKTYNDNANTITVAVDTATIAPLASPALSGIPTAPTAAAGTNTTQIATTAFVSTAVSNLVDSAPGTLDTLNELAAALADDPSFATTITNQIAGKQDVVSGVSSTEIGYLDGVTSAIQTQLNGKAASSHTHAQSDITNLTTDLAAKAPLASPTFTGTVVLPSTTSIGDVSATELGYLDGVTSSIQTQINNISPDPMPQVLMMMGA